MKHLEGEGFKGNTGLGEGLVHGASHSSRTFWHSQMHVLYHCHPSCKKNPLNIIEDNGLGIPKQRNSLRLIHPIPTGTVTIGKSVMFPHCRSWKRRKRSNITCKGGIGMRNIGAPGDSIKQKQDTERIFSFLQAEFKSTASFCGQWVSWGAALLALARSGRTGWTRSCLLDMWPQRKY